MRKMWGLAAVAVVTIVPAALAQAKWPKYAPASGGFTIEMPAQWTPSEGTNNGIKTTSVEVVVNGIDYKAAYLTAVSDNTPLPKGLLDAVRDQLVSDTKAKLRKDQKFPFGGHPCQQIIVDKPDNTTVIARLVNAGDKLIEVAITGPTGVETDPDTMHYFQSFKPAT